MNSELRSPKSAAAKAASGRTKTRWLGASVFQFLGLGPAPFGFRISGFLRISDFGFRILTITLLAGGLSRLRADENAFQRGCVAYTNGDFATAAEVFSTLAQQSPAPGALYNLGNAEWKCGRNGEALLAWERALWLAPFDAGTRNNLRFARQLTQLSAPELNWYEVASTWLPVDAWPWLAAATGWLAAAVLLVPGIFGWRRRDWHQAVAAGAIAIFLLTLPALLGVQSRTRLGVIRAKDTPLRLTPTRDAQTLVKLNAGEMARRIRTRGDYVFVRVGSDATGWVRRDQFGLIGGN